IQLTRQNIHDPDTEFAFLSVKQELALHSRDFEGLRQAIYRLQVVQEETKAKGTSHLEARSHLWNGEMEMLARRYAEAGLAVQKAYRNARRAELPEAVSAAFRFAQVLHHQGRFAAALRWLTQGENLIA